MRLESAPCYNCSERHDYCHSHCPKYIEYDKRRQEVREQQKKDNQLRDDFFAINYERQFARNRAWRDRKNRRERGEHK